MAILNYLGQVPAQWFDASGNAALAGGKLQFFEVGTTTPKAVYSDYHGNTSAGTTVTLDASGRANIWLAGIYSVQLLTAANVPIGNRIDGIGQELAPEVEASAVLSVETYDDLRALTGANVRVCAVEGRVANGDGGAGLFAWDDGETAVDDGGTILTPGTNPVSGRWVRIFSGDMDFRWFGNITGTDDTSAYGIALAASLARQRWLSISAGTVRLTSSVSAPIGSMVRILLGGKIVAASSLVGLGFPAGTLFEGAPGCFGENISVSFGLNAVPAVDVTWWDAANDDTRLAEAGDACADANMEVLIPRAMGLTASYTQPSNAILNFQGPGKLAWSGAGAVAVILRRWKTDANEFPRFTFSSVAKLSSLIMVESQGVYLSPRLFGAISSGGDESAAVWPAILHGWVNMDGVYTSASSLTKTGNVRLRGAESAPRTIATSADIPHGISLGANAVLDITGDLSVSGTGIFGLAGTGLAEVNVSGSFGMRNGYLWGNNLAGVSSFGVQALASEIANSQLNLAPIVSAGSIQDSDVYGSSTYTVSAVDHVGIGGSPWTVDRCYIEEATSFGAARIVDSEIESVGAIAYADGCEIRNSIVTPTSATSAGTASGNVSIHGGNVTLPLLGVEGSDIVIDGFAYSTIMPWNGYGTLTVAGGSETVNNGGTSSAAALRQGANVLDGVPCPRSRVATMGGTETPTGSTSNWTFGSVATPAVVSDGFSWVAGLTTAGTHTISKTITTNAEKTLAAYGGYIIAEWTGDASAITCLFGQESITVVKCPGSTAQRAVFHIWPGAAAATTTYSIRIVHNGGAVTLKATIQPCAPINGAQWEMFWGGDRTLSASRVNSWRGTFAQASACKSLEVMVDTLPGTPFTPALQTLAPWMLVFADPVHAYPRNPNYLDNILTGNVFKAFKVTSGTTFHPQVSGAYP